VIFVWTVPNLTVWTPYPPHYLIWAEADVVPEETDTDDNTNANGSVTVKHPGDVNGDGKVDYIDLFALADAYGSTPEDDNWNPDCDFDGDGKVDSDDLFILSDAYGWNV